MSNKLAENIGLVLAVLTLAGALQAFFDVDLFVKLVALGVAGPIALWTVARWLSNWMRTKVEMGFFGKTLRPSGTKRIVAILALGLICLVFSLSAWLVVCFDAINVKKTREADRMELWIQGSRQAATTLTVLVPPNRDCAPIADVSRAETGMYNWDSSNPYLEISNFSHSHRQGISCDSTTTIDQFTLRPEPSGLEVFYPDRRRKYTMLIFTSGGVLWIASVVFVFLRSR